MLRVEIGNTLVVGKYFDVCVWKVCFDEAREPKGEEEVGHVNPTKAHFSFGAR